MSEEIVKEILGDLARTNAQVKLALLHAFEEEMRRKGEIEDDDDYDDYGEDYDQNFDDEYDEDHDEEYDANDNGHDNNHESGDQEQRKDQQPTTPSPAPIDFDHYSKSAWHTINACKKLRGSRQYEESGHVLREVFGIVATISKRTPKNSVFSTKQSALETIRKIIKSLLLAGDTLGREIRKDLAFNNTIPAAMIRILEDMTPAERIQVGSSEDEKGTLISKVEWVRDEAKAYALEGLGDLEKVVKMMVP